MTKPLFLISRYQSASSSILFLLSMLSALSLYFLLFAQNERVPMLLSEKHQTAINYYHFVQDRQIFTPFETLCQRHQTASYTFTTTNHAMIEIHCEEVSKNEQTYWKYVPYSMQFRY